MDWETLKRDGWKRLALPPTFAPFAKGGFHTPSAHAMGEDWIKRPGGGAVAVLAPSGLSFIYIGEAAPQFTLRPDGALQDISPTVLGILGIPQPKEMTGHDLRVKKQ